MPAAWCPQGVWSLNPALPAKEEATSIWLLAFCFKKTVQRLVPTETR
jgi:hypothetical protein